MKLKMIGCCPECGCADNINLYGEAYIQLQFIKQENCYVGTFNLDDIYVSRHSDDGKKIGKFKCDNCQCVFDNPQWVE